MANKKEIVDIVWTFIEHGYARKNDRIQPYGSITELFKEETKLIHKIYPGISEQAFRRRIIDGCLNAGSFRLEKNDVKRSKHKKDGK